MALAALALAWLVAALVLAPVSDSEALALRGAGSGSPNAARSEYFLRRGGTLAAVPVAVAALVEDTGDVRQGPLPIAGGSLGIWAGTAEEAPSNSPSARVAPSVDFDFDSSSARGVRMRGSEESGEGRDAEVTVVVASVCIRTRFGVENWSSLPPGCTTTTAAVRADAAAETPGAGEGEALALAAGNAIGRGELELA